MAESKEITVASKAESIAAIKGESSVLYHCDKTEDSNTFIANRDINLSPILGGKRMWNYPSYYLKSYTQNSTNKMGKLSYNITSSIDIPSDKQAITQNYTYNMFAQKNV